MGWAPCRLATGELRADDVAVVAYPGPAVDSATTAGEGAGVGVAPAAAGADAGEVEVAHRVRTPVDGAADRAARRSGATARGRRDRDIVTGQRGRPGGGAGECA